MVCLTRFDSVRLIALWLVDKFSHFSIFPIFKLLTLTVYFCGLFHNGFGINDRRVFGQRKATKPKIKECQRHHFSEIEEQNKKTPTSQKTTTNE